MIHGLVKIVDSILVLTSLCLVHSNIANRVGEYLLYNKNLDPDFPLLYLNYNFFYISLEFCESLLQIIDGLILILTIGLVDLSLKYKFMTYAVNKRREKLSKS